MPAATVLTRAARIAQARRNRLVMDGCRKSRTWCLIPGMNRRTFLQAALALPMAAGAQRPHRQSPTPRQAWPGRSGAGPTATSTPRHGHQGHVAGGRTARGLEARAGRGVFVARRRRTACSTRCTASRGEEVVLAANAETGQTLWEHATPMTFVSDARARWATGPYSTPLIVGDRRVHDRRGRTAAVLRQEDRQGAVDAGAVDRTSRLAADVRLRVEPDRVSRTGDRAGRRPRQGGDGVPAGRRQSRVEPQRFRQRLFVAGADQRQRPRADGGADGWRRDRGQSAQRRSAMAGAVQGRLFDRGRRRRSSAPTICCSCRRSTAAAPR